MFNNTSLDEIPFLKQLDEVANKIEYFQKKYCQPGDSVTNHEISEFIKDLELYNTLIEGTLENRKLVLANGQKNNQRIEQALNAVLLFQKVNPDEGTKKNIRQVIASLFNDSEKEQRRFEESIKNLRSKWDSYMKKVHEIVKSNKVN
ncbi:hypothetical protein [Candidatus Protochlamydia sp. R18]|uniref:hypothetical protein n=1 Tax=Candidatus Protochlamydia sp. R18 TaxID=1353977 RepID=UPI0005A74D0F|nr:hypothetical protein [Candidatus Protochlamydia sp. R18]